MGDLKSYHTNTYKVITLFSIRPEMRIYALMQWAIFTKLPEKVKERASIIRLTAMLLPTIEEKDVN